MSSATATVGLGVQNDDGGYGISPGYRSTVIDSAQAAMALAAEGGLSANPEIVAFLLASQRGDGGWPYLVGGPSSVEATAWALRVLSAAWKTEQAFYASQAGMVFLRAHQHPDGSIGDDDSSDASQTAEAVLALAAQHALGLISRDAAAESLRASQWADGSWGGSVYETALALRALREALAPNIALDSAMLSVATATAGEVVVARVVVVNAGPYVVKGAMLRAFDSSGAPFGSLVPVPDLLSGQRVSLPILLDTAGHDGSSQCFFVVDPDGLIEESDETDNRLALSLQIGGGPGQPDLVALQGTLTAVPESVAALPTPVTLTVLVGNVGQTNAANVLVEARVRGTPAGSLRMDMAAGSRTSIAIPVMVAVGAGDVPIEVIVDPAGEIGEARKDNNSVSGVIPTTPGIDVRVANLRLAPTDPQQGDDIEISYALSNRGTTDATVPVEIRMVDVDGRSVGVNLDPSVVVSAGNSLARVARIRASASGMVMVTVAAPHPADLQPFDNQASASISVRASSMANLVVTPADVVATPDPALEGEAMSIATTVRNSGGADATPFALEVWLGTPASGRLLATLNVNGLAAGASWTGTATTQVDGPADLTITAVADAASAVAEFDETDNAAVRNVSVRSRPDLVLSDGALVLSNGFPRIGEAVDVKVTVRNAGEQSSGLTDVALAYVGEDGVARSIGVNPLPSLSGGETTVVAFLWSADTAGAGTIVATVNDAQTTAESNPNNNRAERAVLVQNGSVAVSNPYFSPNGDQVKDTTEIFWRLDPAAEVRIDVTREATGEVVRTLVATGGSATWDGRDETGRVARDARYVLSARAVSSAAAQWVGTATVVLDTNRSLLYEAPSAMLDAENVSAVAKDFYGETKWALLPDDSGIVFARANTFDPVDGWQSGSFLLRFDGKPPTPLPGVADTFVVTADGAAIMYLAPLVVWGNYDFQGIALHRLTLEGGRDEVLWEEENNLNSWSPGRYPPVLSPDGRELAFIRVGNPSVPTTMTIETIDVNGANHRVVADGYDYSFMVSPGWFWPEELSYSPDGQWIDFVDHARNLCRSRLDGTQHQLVHEAGYQWSDSSEPDAALRHLWLPGTTEIAQWLISPGIVAVDPATGATRTLVAAADLGVQNKFYAYAELATDPWGEAFAFPIAPAGRESGYVPGRYRVMLSAPPGAPPRNFYEGPVIDSEIEDMGWSSSGALMHFKQYDNGFYDHIVVRSVGNLGTRLVAAQETGTSGITFRGTAADLNFDRYEIVAGSTDNQERRLVASGGSSIVNGVLGNWIPPGPGVYEATLSAYDRAGNARERRTRFSWGTYSAIANIQRDFEYISPNADGVQDAATLSFSVLEPLSVTAMVSNAAGQQVRVMSATYYAAQDASLVWGGLDDAGVPVPDGEYWISFEGMRFRVVVDTVRPRVEFALLDDLRPRGTTQFSPAMVRGINASNHCVVLTEDVPGKHEVPQMLGNASWQVGDKNLSEWSLEASRDGLPEVITRDSTQELVHAQLAPPSVTGRTLQVVARDLAGNVSYSQPESYDANLFLLGFGGREITNLCIPQLGSLLLGWPSTYTEYPAPFEEMVRFDEARASLPYFVPSDIDLVFVISHTITEPIIARAIAFRPTSPPDLPPGMEPPFQYDYRVEDFLGVAFIWTPPVNVAEFEVYLVAIGASGREYVSKTAVFQYPRSLFAGLDGERHDQLLVYDLHGKYGEPVDAGTGSVTIFRNNSGTLTKAFEFPIAGLEHSGGPTVDAFLVDASRFPDCAYHVSVVGELVTGRPYSAAVDVNLCGTYIQEAQIEGTTARVALRETHRRPVAGAFADGMVAGHSARVAEWGGFSEDSSAANVDLLPMPLCSENRVKLVTEFADGSVLDESANRTFKLCTKDVAIYPGWGQSWREINCEQHQPLVGSLCTFVTVEDWRQSGAVCSGARASLDVRIWAHSEVNISVLTASLVTAAGIPVMPLEVTGLQPGKDVDVIARVPTATLPEGTYLVRANVVAENGTTATDVSTMDEAIEVEHVAPTAITTSPVAGSEACPNSTVSVDGQVVRTLAIAGTVVEANLDYYDVLVKPPSATEYKTYCSRKPSSRSEQVFSGSLCEIPYFGPGEYAARIAARDRTGNETCSPELIFRVPGDLGITVSAPVPTLFSPDGDGQSDQTTIAFQLTEAAEVRVEALLPGQERAQVAGGTYVAGLGTIDWAGARLDGGSLPEGLLTLTVHATGACGQEAQESIAVEIDRFAPSIRIDAPAPGEIVAGNVVVTGSVLDPHLAGYEVSFKPVASGAFQVVESAPSGGVGVLATIASKDLIAGEYVVRVRGWDSLGHSAFADHLFTWVPGAILEGFAVLPPLVSPNGDGRFDDAIGTFGLKQDAAATIEILDGAGAVVATPLLDVAETLGQQHVTLTAALSGLADGDYRARMRATSGGVTEEAIASIAVDRVAPSLHIAAPGAGACLGNSMDVAGAVSDLHQARWSLSLRTIGKEEITLAGGIAPVDGVLVTTQIIADGSYSLVLRGEDVAGNSDLIEVPFKWDSTPPRLALVTPMDGAFVSGRNGALEVLAEIVEENLVSWNIAIDDGASTTRVLGAGSGAVRAAASWEVGVEPDGPVSLRAVAADCVGRQVASLARVVIDNTLPVAVIASPNGTFVRAPLQILGTASDANLESWRLEIASGAPGVAFGFVDLASGISGVNDSILAELISLPPDGQYTLRLVVRDRAGNETENTASFFVDTRPPAPPVLAAQPQRPSDAHLSWTASVSSDVVGYRVMRASGVDVMRPVSPGTVPSLDYVDSGLQDGRWRYTVVAVDEAGLESAPSNEATVYIDCTPPVASISAPRGGATVSGAVDVVGSAYGSDDLREYRLFVGEGVAPTSFSLLRRSPAAVRNDVLGTLDAARLADGSTWTIRLEAEDLAGNVGAVSVTVVVDNRPPGPPNLVTATAAIRDVTLTWEANTEPDLAGYLVYRNAQLVSAPFSALSDPVAAALPKSSNAWVDAGAPDGVLEYRIQAVDEAGNLSPLSNARSVTIDLRAPSARILSPVPLARINGVVDVVAACDDADVASLQIEARAGQGAWVPVGAPRSQAPWVASLDPSLLDSAVIELRAVATDVSGKVDGGPVSLHVLYDPPLAAPQVFPKVDGNDVAVTWTDANSPTLVAGYAVTADGVDVPAGLGVPSGKATASSSRSYLPGNAFDRSLSTVWYSLGAVSQWWQVVLSRTVLVDEVDVTPVYQSKFDVLVRVSGTWVRVGHDLECWGSSTCPVGIDPPVAVEGIRVEFSYSSAGFAGLKEVQLSVIDLWPGFGPVQQSAWEGRHDYTVSARSRFGSMASGLNSALVYSPLLAALPPATAASPTSVSGSNVPGGAEVTLSAGGVAGVTVTAAADGSFSGAVALALGENVIVARAVDAAGNRSLWSAPVFTTFAPPPPATVSLSLSGVTGSDVALGFAPSGDLSSVVGYRFGRDSGSGEVVVGEVAAGARSFTDPAVPNGTPTYRVAAFNGAGIVGAWSNPVTAIVSVAPQPAPGLSISVPAGGAALQLAWTFEGATDACFIVEREISPGVFGVTASRVCTRQYLDTGLSNGTEYRYRVRARDVAGNVGASSNVVAATPRDTQGPRAPRIVEPTNSGVPIVVAASRTTIAGTSDQGTSVELTHNGRFAGRVPADGIAVEASSLGTYRTVTAGFDGSSASGRYAYTFDGPLGEAGITVEDAGGALFAETVLPGLLVADGPWLSPDGARVLFLAYGANWIPIVYEWDALGAGVQAVALDPNRSAVSAAWSADGSRIGYLEQGWPDSYVVVRDAGGAVRRTCAGPWSASLRWISDVEVAAVQEGSSATIVACNVDTDATRKIFESGRVLAWTSGAAGRVAAVSEDSSYTTTLQLVSADGGPATVLGGSDGGLPAFSPDGGRIAWFNESGELVVGSTAGGEPGAAGYQQWGGRLSWAVPSRMLFQSQWGHSQPTVLDVLGRFEVPVVLDVGENGFSAIASDRDGNLSPRSEPISVRLDVGLLPDLGLTARIQPSIPVASSGASALVTIRNAGSVASAPADVDAWLELPSGRRAAPRVHLPSIPPNAEVVAVFPLDLSGLVGDQLLVAVVDPLRLNADADPSNDRAQVPFTVAASDGISLLLSAAPAEMEVDGSVTATAQIVNPGPASDGVLTFAVVAGDGPVAVSLPNRHLSIGAATVARDVAELPMAGLLAGNYLVRATFVPPTGGAVTATTPVTLLPETSVSLRLATSRAEYLPAESIDLTSFVTNASRNAPLSGAQLTIEVRDASGTVTWTSAPQPLPMIWLGGEVEASTTIPSGVLAAGAYEARAIVSLDGAELAVASTTFSVATEPLLVGEIHVAASGSPPVVKRGVPLPVTVTARNAGTGTALDVLARLVTVDGAGAIVATQEVALGDLAPLASNGFSASLPTDSLALGVYGLALTAMHDGKTESIATSRFRVADGLAPTLAFLNLTEGMFVRESVTVRIQANDDASGVTAVTASAEGVAGPLALEGGNPISGVWMGSVALPTDGPHTVSVSARDAEGNDGAFTPGPLNPIAVTVIRDTIPPELSITGVAGGALVNHAVNPIVTATDLHLATVETWLDGAGFTQGTTVITDGDHLVRASAVDRAGNTASASLRFTIDQTPPRIAILGVGVGAYSAADVTPRIVVEDAHLDGYTATLDGAPFVDGTVLSGEHTYQLAVQAKDLAGNVATETVAFTIDKTPPLIQITGVSEGEWLSRAAVPDVTLTDANLLASQVTLDGTAFLPGTPVAAEGEHVLYARAVDKAGNPSEKTVRFFIDLTRPIITIAGVKDGDLVNYPVTPIVTVTDTNLSTFETRIDGVISLPAAAVSSEGKHVVEVTASDLAGNQATARVAFEIDTTPPVIWASVENGASYPAPLTVTFKADDPHLGQVTATMDGQPFFSGGELTGSGAHLLVVTARDLAGNEAEKRVDFNLADQLRADLTKEGIGRSANVLAWVSDGCRLDGSDTARVRSFIARSLPAGSFVEFAASSADFRTRLRSGEFGVYAVATVANAGSGGDERLDVGSSPACDRFDALNERELTEAVFRGAGLVVLKAVPNEVPELREAAGVHAEGQEQYDVVRLIASAFTEPGLLAVGGGIELELEGSAAVGWFGENGDDVAVSAHPFGLGEAVVFAFDLAAALPPEVASATFARAIGYAAGEAELLPDGVVGVQIRVQNRGGAASYRVVETLDPALDVVRVLDQGASSGSSAIEWRGQLEVDETETLRYFVRLPASPGTFGTTTGLFLRGGASERFAGEAAMPLVLTGDGASLQAAAELAVQRLPAAKADGEIRRRLLTALAGVATNTGTTSKSREDAISALLDAAALSAKLQTVDPAPVRVAIDRLLAYWEMKP